MLPIDLRLVMRPLTAAIERGFYAAIQWSLKHQGPAVACLLLAALVPLGTLNLLQYQTMAQYRQQGNQAMQEQLQYLLGRLVLESYNNLNGAAGKLFHRRNNEHEELFSGDSAEVQATVDLMQQMLQESCKCESVSDTRAAFVLEGNRNWAPRFPSDLRLQPPAAAAAARARADFVSRPPDRQDVGFYFYYDRPSERLFLMHPVSPEPFRDSASLPPRRIRAVMGVIIDREELKYGFTKAFSRDHTMPSRYDTPIGVVLARADYYFEIRDEHGRIIYQDSQWKKYDGCDDYIQASFLVTPEQGFLTGWRVSAMTPSTIGKVTDRSLQQMFLASAVVAVLLCLLLIILFRAGMVTAKVSNMQTDIVAGVSHDLKTPLAGILASAQLIASGRASKPQDVKEFSGYIMAEARRLTAVVEKVLTMAKLESQQLTMQPTPVSLLRLVDQAIESVRCAFPGVTIVKGDVPDDDICADYQGLTTVLVNLIDNAVRYSREQPAWVQVDAHWVPGGERRVLYLQVSDRGIGIPPEEQPFIFQ